MNLTKLTDPVAIVTGAGSGIGRATAFALAREGYRLILVGRRQKPLEDTAAGIGGPESVIALPADVTSPHAASLMVSRAIDHFGRLDALVNNAGYAPLLPIERTTPEEIDKIYRVNAIAPAYAIAEAWPTMVRQGRGVIVNVSTMGTLDPYPGFFGYAAAKAAVNLMARSCANEGREHGIRAFAVAPVAVETEMLRAIFPETAIPKERAMHPDDVARVIVECITGKRDRQNGETIVVSRE